MMLQVLKVSSDRQRAERLLATTTRTLHTAFLQYVTNASKVPANVLTLLGQGNIKLLLDIVDRHILQFANNVTSTFVDVASAETSNSARKLVHKAAPQVTVTFDATNPRAAELMRANRLKLVTSLSRQQREVTRSVLVAGLQNGLSPTQMARQFRQSIGLTAHQLNTVDSYERALNAGSVDALQRELRDRRFDSTVRNVIEGDAEDVLAPNQIDRMTSRYRENLVRLRAETISRTESLKVIGSAQDEAMKQSLEATGTSSNLVGKEWEATLDARTRDAHSERGGQRRALDVPFAQGIMRPGDGGPDETINCRCVLSFFFADTPEQLADWLGEGE